MAGIWVLTVAVLHVLFEPASAEGQTETKELSEIDLHVF